MKHKKVIGISIMAVLILAAGIVLFVLRGNRQQTQGVISEPDAPVTGTPAATQAPAETLKTLTQRPKEDSLFTQTFEALYTGKIDGTRTIEIQLQMNDRFVKGGYRLEDEQEWIEFTGVYEDNAFYLAHDLKKHVECTYVAEDMLEGFLEDGGQIHPFYAAKEGKTIQAPVSPDERLAAWEGKWYGAGSPEDATSLMTITPIFNNLVWFEIAAKLEDSWSGFFSFAIVQDNTAVLIVGKDYFRFYRGENGSLILDSSNYTYHCDDGAKFDTEYVRAPLEP